MTTEKAMQHIAQEIPEAQPDVQKAPETPVAPVKPENQPEPSQSVTPEAQPNLDETPDIITRVSQHKQEKPQTADQDTFFDYKEIEKIEDPQVRELAEKAYKQMQADYTRKTQEISSERKALQDKLSQETSWTPDRINQLLQDQNFVSTLQQYYSSQQNTGSEDTWLSPEEQSKLNALEQQIQMMQQKEQQNLREQQHQTYSTKYANYDRDAVEGLWNEMLTGQRQATLEDFHKVVDYDNAINRAYELGRTDEREGINKKVESNTVAPNMQSVNRVDMTQREENESPREFLKRTLFKRMSEHQKQ